MLNVQKQEVVNYFKIELIIVSTYIIYIYVFPICFFFVSTCIYPVAFSIPEFFLYRQHRIRKYQTYNHWSFLIFIVKCDYKNNIFDENDEEFVKSELSN